MKPEEAIEVLNEILDVLGHNHYSNSREYIAVDTAIESLEKQVPKKPRYYVDMYGHNRPGCPGCPRNEILYAGQKYCSVCGTKIDWSEEK